VQKILSSGYKIPSSLKSAYGRTLRLLRRPAEKLGILRFLETHRNICTLLYLRTLFSIYDSEDLVRLDLPWWSFDAINTIETFLYSRGDPANIFEYGSGASTVWLAKRGRTVYSVEHDSIWAERTRNLCRLFSHVSIIEEPPQPAQEHTQFLSGGCKYKGFSFDNYVLSIDKSPSNFDLIVIDGMCRKACLQLAIQKIKEDGIIVFDDSARDYWTSVIDASGLFVKRYPGLAVALPYPSETAILSKNSGILR